MKVTILGSGTSTGVPEIGCTCEVCVSTDPRDHRLRTSVLVETKDARILIDCGPDFRQQMLPLPFEKLDAVLLTHEHYDHVGGVDDLRPFCRFGEVPVYAEKVTADRLRTRLPYCFAEHRYPGVPAILLRPIEIGEPFEINTTQVIPLRAMHGRLPIVGFRIREMGYVTDVSYLPEETFLQLQGVKQLFINALRLAPHDTHQNLGEALKTAGRIGAEQTWFIHMSHQMGLHAVREKELPEHVHLAYDGLEITWKES
ncbi:MAG: MBL fold metallo-hydrolase [Bacteroides sp.]|nr:MBL fold metallo-hydrolase [Bacteroides sp.]